MHNPLFVVTSRDAATFILGLQSVALLHKREALALVAGRVEPLLCRGPTRDAVDP